MEVLEKSISKHVLARCRTYDRGNSRQTSLTGRTPPPLTHDELISIVNRRDNHRLQNAHRLDRFCQLRQAIVVKDFAWLLAIWPDLVNINERES